MIAVEPKNREPMCIDPEALCRTVAERGLPGVTPHPLTGSWIPSCRRPMVIGAVVSRCSDETWMLRLRPTSQLSGSVGLGSSSAAGGLAPGLDLVARGADRLAVVLVVDLVEGPAEGQGVSVADDVVGLGRLAGADRVAELALAVSSEDAACGGWGEGSPGAGAFPRHGPNRWGVGRSRRSAQ